MPRALFMSYFSAFGVKPAIFSNEKMENKHITAVMGGRQRCSNLELYRIVVMLLIVAHHYVVNSGVWDVMEVEPMSGKSLYLYILGMWGKTGINCFVLITGYFMCKSQITIRKFLKLLLEVLFYNLVIWAIFIGTGYEEFSVKAMVKAFMPVVSIADGFTSCFIIFYLFIPFLNILVKNMSRQQHKHLALLLLFVYTLLGSVPKFHVVFNYVTWFVILFIISSYIRLYGLFPRINNRQWGYFSLLMILLAAGSMVAFLYLHTSYGIKLMPYRLVADSNKIFAVVAAVCTFMYFKDLPIKQSRLINTISASTFGVLCIHANSDTMRQWLWKDIVDCIGQYGSTHLMLLSLASILLIFLICILIDYIRIHSIEKWTFSFIDKLLVKYGLQ